MISWAGTIFAASIVLAVYGIVRPQRVAPIHSKCCRCPDCASALEPIDVREIRGAFRDNALGAFFVLALAAFALFELLTIGN